MLPLISVMAGGAIGAGARYYAGLLIGSPWATLAVNLTGGLLMGLLVGRGVSEPWRLFAGVGILGGFTTFSAFGLDSWAMIERGQWGFAAGYVLASVLGAIALTGLGTWIVRN